ncbi:Uncharacterised protein [Clostridium sporogenes]|nr:Uncharacterised protein [Clostridium sporogenes]
MRDHGRVTRALRHFDCRERFGQRTDLVDLDEDRVRDALLDAFLQDARVRDEQVVADQLYLLAEAVGQQLPAVPVAFVHAVLDRHDRELVGERREVVGEFGRRQLQAFARELVLAVVVELGCRAVEREQHVFARTVAGLLDRLQDRRQAFVVAAEVRCETAFVADGRAHAAIAQDLLQRVEHFRAATQRFTERRLADRDDHEFLDVQAVVRVRAAVDDVHHRHRQLHRARTAEVAVQRQAGLFGGRLRDGHRHGQHRVRAQARLVVGAVQLEQRLVEERLFRRVEAHDGFGDFGVDVLDCLQHALAVVAAGFAVAQFDRFTRAGGRARRHRRAAHRARFEQHVAFDGGVAARIQNLAADDIYDCTHGFPLRMTMDSSNCDGVRAGTAFATDARSRRKVHSIFN